MSKKNLVQELRELAKETDVESPACKLWEALAGKDVIDCFDGRHCVECRALALNALADRIEREYDPDPEPDTLEKVAKDMAAYLSKAMRGEDLYASEMTAFVRRAEALGVKVDE